MTRPATIAIIGAVQVGKLFAFAVTILAACEAVNWALMWRDSRHG